MARVNRAGRKPVRAGRSALINRPSWNTDYLLLSPSWCLTSRLSPDRPRRSRSRRRRRRRRHRRRSRRRKRKRAERRWRKRRRRRRTRNRSRGRRSGGEVSGCRRTTRVDADGQISFSKLDYWLSTLMCCYIFLIVNLSWHVTGWPPSFVQFRSNSSDFVRFRPISSDFVRFRQISSDFVRFRPISSDFLRATICYCRIFRAVSSIDGRIVCGDRLT